MKEDLQILGKNRFKVLHQTEINIRIEVDLIANPIL